MQLIQTEAIVLQSILFKEYDRILTLLSPQGLIKFFVKGKKKEYLHQVALTSPLTFGEFQYIQGRKDLHRLHEGSILKQNLRIRENYETLITAEKMIQALLCSQWPGKPSSKLFQLFVFFIEQLPNYDASLLYTVLLLKILKHEGVLHLSIPIEAAFRYAGERYAQTTAPQGALFFTEEEETLLTECALSRSLTHLAIYAPSAEFQKKVELLFFQTFKF